MLVKDVWHPFSGEAAPDFSPVDDTLREGLPDIGLNGDSNVKIHPNPWYRQTFGDFTISEHPMYQRRALRIIATGAGCAGLQVAYKFQKHLQDLDLIIYEKNDSIGGTWFENRYPGCACDIPSVTYQFYWNRNPNWSSFYAPAAEILKYLKDTADKYDLNKYIKFQHKVLDCSWDEAEGKWICQVQRPDGTTFTDEADILLNTSGGLNVWRWPNVEGLQSFRSSLMHSASWDSNIDLEGKVVAVVGSGSSAIQIVPNIQPRVKKLLNFVRSPVWLTPGFSAKNAGPEGGNFKYTEEQKETFRKNLAAYDSYIKTIESDLGGRFPMLHANSTAQIEARKTMEQRMRDKIGNKEVSDYLVPNFGLGCRRLSPGDEYMACFTKDNVQMIRSTLTKVTEDGVVDQEGNEHKVDVIICATGFDTSFTPSYKIVGRNKIDLKTFYAGFPRSYLGLMTPRFPNYFQFPGPGSPSSHGPIIAILEWLTRYTMQVVSKMQREGIKAVEPRIDAAEELYNWSHTMHKRLVFSQPCASWYKNGNRLGPVTSQYPGTRLHFCETLRTPRYEDFEITYWSHNRFQYLGNGFTQDDIDGKNLTWYLDAPDI